MGSHVVVGFPALTAWLGAVHALERRLQRDTVLQKLQLPAVAIACHHFDLQTHKGPHDRVRSLIITANPLQKKGAEFKRPAFIEEARIHLDVSLLIEVAGLSGEQYEILLADIKRELMPMKMAGGDIISCGEAKMFYVGDDAAEKKVIHSLMPGYVLLERRDLLEKKMQAGMNGLDALLDYLVVKSSAEKDKDGNVIGWQSRKEALGWLVPIAVGFKGLSPLGKVKNQRDLDTPHRFAESVVTLGEFKMAHKIHSIDEMMWHYQYHEAENMYLCSNQE
jgi:CRISPR-associated protein Csy2